MTTKDELFFYRVECHFGPFTIDLLVPFIGLVEIYFTKIME